MIVYMVKNLVNGKVYIGKTSTSAEKRFKRHCYEAFSKNKLGKRNYYFHSAIVKYGVENFEIIELCECLTNNECSDRERFYIKHYNSKNHEIGYNLTDGGEGVIGRKKTKEEIEKHKQKLLGRKLSDEHKKAISKANKGRVISKQTKTKISLKNSGENNGNYGKAETLESRIQRGKSIAKSKKIHQSQRGNVSAEVLRRVATERLSEKIPSKIKDEIVELYDSGLFVKRDLSEKFNIPFASINNILRYWKDVRENSKNKPSQEQRDMIVSLKSCGISYDEISLTVGLEKSKIINIYKAYMNKLRRNSKLEVN